VVRRIMSQRVPALEAVLAEVRKNNMLPAIWFILSRKECDISALKVTSTLTTDAERAEIQAELDHLT
jgi:superfamily II RNA helicase